MNLAMTAIAALAFVILLVSPGNWVVAAFLLIAAVNVLLAKSLIHHPRIAAVLVFVWPASWLLTFGMSLFLFPTFVVSIGVVAWAVMDRFLSPPSSYTASIEVSQGPQQPAANSGSSFDVFR